LDVEEEKGESMRPLAVKIVVIVDKVHWIFVVRADKIKPLFTPKV
jgi:hypothetical protein